jgi:MFS family permease
MPSHPPADNAVRTANARRAAFSGFLGSTLEYYDFFIYASAAALVFKTVFFTGAGAHGSIISIATLGVAYVARPLGAILWGHLGDRFGRRDSLLACLLTMGMSTFLIGCLPTYSQVGMLAPVLLVLLRLIQGLSAGGESPGSCSLTLEHAPERLRAFFTSFTLSGVMFGIVISSLVFIPFAALPDTALYSWGWRVPFLLSIVVTALSIWVRRKLDEPEVFEDIKEHDATAGIPFVELIRSDWRVVLRVAVSGMFPMINTIVNVFALSFAVNQHGFERSTILFAISAANFVAVVTQPIYAFISDRIGRRPVFIVGVLAAGVMVFVFFAAVGSGSVGWTFAAVIVLLGVFYAMPNAVYPAYFPEQFPAQVRYTGMAVSLMLGLLIAGFTPALADMMTGGSGRWMPVAWMCLAFSVAAAIAVYFSPETFRTPTADLGRRTPGIAAAIPAAAAA